MKIVVDIDGTLCEFRGPIKCLLQLPFFKDFGVSAPNDLRRRIIAWLACSFYSLIRRPNHKLIKQLRKLARKGETIFIFSAVPEIKKQRQAIEKWLRKNRVPFKGVFLMKERETPIKFKIRVVKEIRAQVVIENDFIIIKEILRLPVPVSVKIPPK